MKELTAPRGKLVAVALCSLASESGSRQGYRSQAARQALAAHLPKLLDRVERGESVTITRHGRPVAQLVPCVRCGGDRALAAVRHIAALRELNPICDFELHEVTSLDVARSYGLSVYDAAYAEVARPPSNWPDSRPGQ